MAKESGRAHLLTREKDTTDGSSIKPDINTVEMIFGTPNTPKTSLGGKPDIHHVTNERRRVEKEPTTNLNGRQNRSEVETFSPLLEPDKGRPKPPLAGPEIDDLDDETVKPVAPEPYPGIDDGLLEDDNPKRHKDHSQGGSDDGDHSTRREGSEHDHHHGEVDGKWPNGGGADEADTHDGFPGYDHRFDDRPGSPFPPGSIPDVNTYQQKKNLAQGMMDLALLSANANQLRYVLELSSSGHPYFYFSLVFISLSIILQVAVGVGLIMNSRYNVKDDKDICKADKINNFTVLGIFLITAVNVFITAFSVASTNNNVPPNVRTDVQNIG